MAFKHIGTKILTIAIPVITVSMVTLNVVSVHTCRGIIDKQISAHMTSELNSQMNQIEAELSTVSNMATVVSRQVGSTYKSVPWDQYESALQNS